MFSYACVCYKKKVVDPASDTDDKADTDIEVDLCNDLESSSSHSNTHIDHRKIRRQCLNRPRSSPSPHDDEAGTASPEPVSIKFVRLAFILILSCAISFCILNKRRIQLNTLQQLCCLKRGNTQFSHFLSFFVDEIFKFLIEVVYSFNKTFSFSLFFLSRREFKSKEVATRAICYPYSVTSRPKNSGYCSGILTLFLFF